ncbi:MAG: hypothetical protein LQ350_002277 [Teloschistes chrysophthalmus]|nr:MAG: hypothetical protein LQ350_002277 [Niorma chrysophthalma]
MAELFCGVFELLDGTGWKANNMFHAALIKRHDEEAAVQIPQRVNEWTAALRDTHLIGAYVINEKCLNSDVHYYSISACNVAQGFTMLQTRLSPSDYNLEPLACERSEITLFAIKDKSLFQLGERLTYVELLTGSSDLGKHLVHIRSSTTSFHGRLTAKRADQPHPYTQLSSSPRETPKLLDVDFLKIHFRQEPDETQASTKDKNESSTGASERHGSEADDGGPKRSDVYGQESWYHADGTTGIANDMANYHQ